MHSFIQRAFAVALLTFAVPALTGCDIPYFTVVIPDFQAAAVEGVQVWRIDDATGQPAPRGQIVLGEVLEYEGIEYLEYTQLAPDGSELFTLPTKLVRPDPSRPDQVRIDVFYTSDGPQGWYKVSTFNAAGSSPLSQAQTFL